MEKFTKPELFNFLCEVTEKEPDNENLEGGFGASGDEKFG